jgi:hypothetical protein
MSSGAVDESNRAIVHAWNAVMYEKFLLLQHPPDCLRRINHSFHSVSASSSNHRKEDTMSKTPKATAFFFVLLVAGCASLQSPRSAVEVPEKLRPGANESLAMIVPAKGVQIYECRARKDRAGEYEWSFVAPEADLFDASGKKIGRHYAGPHWESTTAAVLGATKERADFGGHAILAAAREVGGSGRFVRQGQAYSVAPWWAAPGPVVLRPRRNIRARITLRLSLLCHRCRLRSGHGRPGNPASIGRLGRLVVNQHMLELRPTCEHCNKALPPDSLEARICSYECVLPGCVESVSATSAPTAAAGSSPGPSGRRNWKGDNFLGKDPPAPGQAPAGRSAAHAKFSAPIRDIPPEKR